MNVGDDIAQLSYKELQALALRYRVPGNIKKKVLVKVLQAARSGNETEFSRLLQELRKNRKRKTKKPKDPKLGITSTPLHSPDYIMAEDDYYYHQQQQQPQQQPHQWIGAEEEIGNKDDDNKIPHYEEFKQFLLKRIQRDFQTCNTNNNNQIQDLSIMDLRTAAISPNNVQSIPLDVPSCPKASLIDADPLAIPTIDRYQVLKEPEGSSQGSFLLKRMLQAPVGANLGEIASSLFWASNLLDNSDTLTAESDNENEEDQLETAVNTTQYYNLLKDAKNEFYQSEASLRSMETPMPQTSAEDHYRYPGNMENRPNYQNWTVTSVMELPESDLQSSKVFHAVYYNNTDPTIASNVANNNNNNNNPSYQYQINAEAAYNGNQNFLSSDVNYAIGADAMAVNDSSDIYHSQNVAKNSEELDTTYYRGIDSLVQNAPQQSVYPENDQAFSNSIRSIFDTTLSPYQYLYPRFNQEIDNTLYERLENPQVDANAMTGIESGVNQVIGATDTQESAVNGTLEPFWPKWTVQAGKNLENILNYHVSKQVDYAKLAQTSCVYCYVAPIVSHRSSLANSTCSQVRRYTAEQRQHSFTPYWMLYNDTAQGMRMTNTSKEPPEPFATTLSHASTIPGNDDHLRKEIVGDSIETPINDVWMNQYEPVSTGKKLNVQVSDLLFCGVVTGLIDDIPMPDIAKT